MKNTVFTFQALVIGMFFFSSPALAANEFLLLDKEKSKSNLPSTDEYKSFQPGQLLSDETVKQNAGTEEKKEAADVEIIIEDTDNEKVMTLENIILKFQAGEYDGLLDPLENIAAAGNALAEEMLGIMYYGGKGVERNPANAFKYFLKAAENNRVIAQHHLGVMYFTGEGTIPDQVKSLMWLHIAIAHYQDGPEKKRAIEDRDNIFLQLARREKERALEMAREWLSLRGEAHLLDFQ